MRHKPLDSIPATAAPTTEDMLLVWRADHCVQDSSAGVYLQWIRRFRVYCSQRNLDERAELTLAGARRFSREPLRVEVEDQADDRMPVAALQQATGGVSRRCHGS